VNMSKTDIKHQAQDCLLAYMANAILAAQERGDDPAVIDELNRQAARAMRMFGVTAYAGINSQ